MTALPPGVDPDDTQYGYIPTEWVCILFVVLFGLSTILHLVQSIYFRMWWLLATVILAGIGEVIGWVGRLWSSQTFLANALNPFLMQICVTIISPTPLVAANFVILGVIIGHLGEQYSRLTPKWYTIVFVMADVIALVVQAVGGASASSAAKNHGDASVGGNIMLAGIIVQLVSIFVYSVLAVEYFYRYLKEKPVRKGAVSVRRTFDQRIQLMMFGLALSTIFLFIRAVYRTIELADGWTGRVIRTEVYFNVLDGAMIVLAMYTVNFLHPGFLLAHVEDVRIAAKGSREDDVNLAQAEYASSALEKGRAGSDDTATKTQVG